MVSKKHSLEPKNILTSYHHSFAGGSKNTSRLLHYLSLNGFNVNAYFFETPQYFKYTESPVKLHTLSQFDIHSEVIDSNAINNYLVTDKIVQELKRTNNPKLFGANLFPYCNILLDAKIQSNSNIQSNSQLIVHPVGSDIWHLGMQLPSRVKWILENPLVDYVITYSEKFVSEIKEYFNIQRDIHVLPPVLEAEKFFPLDTTEITKRRKLLGFNDDVFIMHHHSSMRRIKCPEIILEIANKAAQVIPEKCILIMTGPIPSDEVNFMNFSLIKVYENEVFLYKTELGNLTIYWTGVSSEVEYIMQVSNVELNSSLHDSFNISLLEAMACAIPVVTSNSVGISKHIEKAKGGFCYPTKRLIFDELNKVLTSGDPKRDLFDLDFAISSIEHIAKNRIASRIIGEAAASYVKKEFSLERVSKEFYKYING